MSAQTAELIYSLQADGWNVIPIERGTKVPVRHDGQGNSFPLLEYFERKMTEDEVRRWTSLPNADNLGVILGNTSDNLVVVDVDDLSRVEDYRTRYPTMSVRTPSGGLHLYYRNTTGQPLPNGKLEPGVEVFTNRHYALLPPSVVSGERNGRTYSGEYEWISRDDIKPFPPEYIAKLLGASPSQTTRTGKYSADEIRELVNHVIMNGKFQEGSHNDTLYHGTLLLASKGWTEDEIEQIFLRADARDATPQGERVVRSAVARAFAIHEDRKREYNERKDVSTNKVLVTEAPKKLVTLDYSQFQDAYADYQVSWLVEDWITEHAVVMMAAPPGNYKSWVSYDMAMSIALGVPFQNEKEVKGPSPVILIQQEDPMFILSERLRIIERGKLAKYGDRFELTCYQEPDGTLVYYSEWAELLEANLHVYPEADIKLSPDSMEALRDKVAQIRPSLVVIDPFYSLDNSSEYFMEAGDKIRSLIKPIRNQYGTAFLLIHHTRKSNAAAQGDIIPPPTRDSVFGSQLMNAATEGMIILYRPRPSTPTTVGVVRFFKNAPADELIWFDMQINAKSEDPALVYNANIIPVNGMSDLEKEIVVLLESEGPMTASDIAKEVNMDRSNLTKKLKEFKNIEQGQDKKWSVIPDVRIDV